MWQYGIKFFQLLFTTIQLRWINTDGSMEKKIRYWINGERFYTYKVDIYSLGIIFFELLVAAQLAATWQYDLELKQIKFPALFSKYHPKEKLLLEIMLNHDPDSRPTTYGIRARPPLREQMNRLVCQFYSVTTNSLVK
ncbi:probable serine/threonine-protein kinase ifkC isoform X2 [Artemia franciscana]|uniref:probable serine/threonine-protein kinase ifkC isoform X2 n=1 Tax=Artemia franciscana TaxID=6661 RepID=UPI0032DB05F1